METLLKLTWTVNTANKLDMLTLETRNTVCSFTFCSNSSPAGLRPSSCQSFHPVLPGASPTRLDGGFLHNTFKLGYSRNSGWTLILLMLLTHFGGVLWAFILLLDDACLNLRTLQLAFLKVPPLCTNLEFYHLQGLPDHLTVSTSSLLMLTLEFDGCCLWKLPVGDLRCVFVLERTHSRQNCAQLPASLFFSIPVRASLFCFWREQITRQEILCFLTE